MMKKGSSLLLALLMLLAALTGCSAGEDNSLVSQTPFPEFSEVDTGGNPVSSDIFADYDATIVNFWNNGCGTCIEEMPELEELYHQFQEQNINLIGVGTDSGEGEEQLETAQNILKEKGVTFDYADYYANAQADQTNLNQIGADLVADGVDVIVAVATPTAATMLAAVEDTDIPVVYSAVTDPAAAGFDTEPNITGTSDALNTDAIMNLILAVNPDVDTIGLLYDLSQDASTQAIADAKAFCDGKGIKYIEKNGTTTAEVQMAAEALIAAGVKAVFTPTDNTVMTAELSIYETFIEAGVQHYTGADSFALNGAFVGYGVDYVQLGEATADMVVELLCDGKTPADLPFQTFDNGIATINTETCEALGLDLDTVKKAFAPYCTEVVEVTTAENFG